MGNSQEDRLLREPAEGDLSRRKFMAQGALAALAASGVGGLLSGCSGGGGDSLLRRVILDALQELDQLCAEWPATDDPDRTLIEQWLARLDQEHGRTHNALVNASDDERRRNIHPSMDAVYRQLLALSIALQFTGAPFSFTPTHLLLAWARTETLLLPLTLAARRSLWIYLLLGAILVPSLSDGELRDVAEDAEQRDTQGAGAQLHDLLRAATLVRSNPLIFSLLLVVVPFLLLALKARSATQTALFLGWMLPALLALYALSLARLQAPAASEAAEG
ncbi:MAG: hypothetical protein FJX74_03640 [Armatimonadetes bacterium]|nr:hypothetical protein [Armatimonadota bacterium]